MSSDVNEIDLFICRAYFHCECSEAKSRNTG